LNDNTCPFKIVKPAEPPITLLQSLNTANLKKIVFNIHSPVLLRLLVCKKEKNTQRSTNCLYLDHKNSNAVNIACNSQDELAHIYLRNEQTDDAVQSCVISFIEATDLFTPNGLLKLYKNTLNWLNIANERPYYYAVMRYGKPQASVYTDYANKILNREIKKMYNNYPKDENICIIIQAEKQSKYLRIDYKSKKFYIKPQG
jgi:hypothetical protein